MPAYWRYLLCVTFSKNRPFKGLPIELTGRDLADMLLHGRRSLWKFIDVLLQAVTLTSTCHLIRAASHIAIKPAA